MTCKSIDIPSRYRNSRIEQLVLTPAAGAD